MRGRDLPGRWPSRQTRFQATPSEGSGQRTCYLKDCLAYSCVAVMHEDHGQVCSVLKRMPTLTSWISTWACPMTSSTKQGGVKCLDAGARVYGADGLGMTQVLSRRDPQRCARRWYHDTKGTQPHRARQAWEHLPR
ncbi:hypothetical protein GWK47_017298 [Chionoecetes opilio]|uniref:Uncharacterized protein n=1 Tax=Chionoecetes opilio TaxID=41210 RepID=A0A8J4XRI3_CHIOP|nr:hypothetical protein GWK47_017298 [Chionoecetes opilio]